MTIIQTWHVAQGKYIFGKPVLVRNVHSPSVFIFTRINYENVERKYGQNIRICLASFRLIFEYFEMQ